MNKNKKIILFLVTGNIIFLPFFTLAATGEPKCPDNLIYLNVSLGGKTCVEFGEFIQIWYNFAVGAVGIMAVIMIMWGGFRWLTSRGNATVISDAKDRIFGAIIGLVLVFLSYTLLNLINPNLTKIELPTLSHVNVVENLPGSHGTPTQDTPSNDTPYAACNGNTDTVLNFDGVPAKNPNVGYDSETNGWFDKYGNQYGVDPDKLRAIAAAESSGRTNLTSKMGAAGLMQILPKTATDIVAGDTTLRNHQAFADGAISAEELNKNPELSIAIASKFVSLGSKGKSLADTFAGYNGGYATSGKGHALSQSVDCPTPGVKAYTCCKNPGGLAETQKYVDNTMSYYKYYQTN